MTRQTPPPDQEIVAEALQVANLGGDRLEQKGNGLSEAETVLYRTILRAFPAQGGPPSLDDVHATARGLGLDPESAVTRLHERDLIRLDATGTAIASAYPFSGQPTAHRVEIVGAQPVYAMCAIDALGIPFMLDAQARIHSVDPVDGTPLELRVQDGQAACEPASAVVLIGSTGQAGPSAQVCCFAMNFFASPDTAEIYQRAHAEVQGRIVGMPEALEAGKQVFSNLLRGEEPGCCDASDCR